MGGEREGWKEGGRGADRPRVVLPPPTPPPPPPATDQTHVHSIPLGERVAEASRTIDKETTEKLAEVELVGERQKLVLEERLKKEFAHAKDEAERSAEEKKGAFQEMLAARRKRGEQRTEATMKEDFAKWRKEQEKAYAKKRKEYAANFRALVEREKAEREKQRLVLFWGGGHDERALFQALGRGS